MPVEPAIKRAVGFIDGQNLFRHAKDALGYYHPNYHPKKLVDAVCATNGWKSQGARFYTGVPTAGRDPDWHAYWNSRLLGMRRSGTMGINSDLKYHSIKVAGPNGEIDTVDIPREKGIDVRLALDVVRMARHGQFDVAILFSQDQDLAEVAAEVRDISITEDRWLKVVSAFPVGPDASSARGIDRADWFRIDRTFYDSCIDERDYRSAEWEARTKP
ncbi:MAG: NYN domain-containing protein [Alphaproteobacteria bacterium]|nr:NYN domain-containing protein [Alphaproteobacteria bacterium]